LGGGALVVLGLLPVGNAVAAIAGGADVYLFLAGMMVLAELSRREGVFEWLAQHAVAAARGSGVRLFALIYAVGVLVTTLLSNDATAIVLTPAVAASVRRAGAAPLAYLYVCAFVANAASFVLPISNPANLVVFSFGTPRLSDWLAAFALPSVSAIALTFVALFALSRSSLRGSLASGAPPSGLSGSGRVTIVGLALAAIVLLSASALGWHIGASTFAVSALLFATVALSDRHAIPDVSRSVSWGILLLVAGLFVLIRGLDGTGIIDPVRHAVAAAATQPRGEGPAALAIVAALATNLTNNLPAGVFAASSLGHIASGSTLREATAIGIDLGPNLSVGGSLATVLWLAALRREGIEADGWAFFRCGVIVMPAGLVAALAALLLTAR
jgi:arsenical pump membrane protein